LVDIACVVEAGAELGEGPLWDPRDQVLWWVDIKGRRIHRYDPASGENRSWATPDDIGCLCVREQGGLVVAMRHGLYFFDPQDGRFEAIVDPEADRPGSMYEGPDPQATAALYRLDTDLSCQQVVTGIVCSNGLAWSPDSRVMYYADSLAQQVWAWDFDASSGTVANRRPFIDTRPFRSNPDGATVDAEGCYWLTLPEADKLARFDPSGKAMRVIDMPVYHPTCAMFGGPDLDLLYVTTATMFRSPEALALQPQAGGLFAMDVGVRGLPEAHFRG
jgi:sugar lactone lactonase YvrE